MKFGPLNDENFIMYAMQAYDNPVCKGINEFNDDLTRVKYIKRLLNRYDKKKDLKERLIGAKFSRLNNNQVFGANAEMTFFVKPRFV